MENVKAVNGLDLKKYIKSGYEHNITTNGCILFPKSAVTLALPNVPKDSDMYIGVRKQSGNGKICINNQNYIVRESNKDQIIKFKSDNGVVFIHRKLANVFGQILITTVGVSGLDNTTTELISNMSQIIEQLSSVTHVGINIGHSEVHAAQSAVINLKNVPEIYLNTYPPNCYNIEKNKIIFINPCQILNIDFGFRKDRPLSDICAPFNLEDKLKQNRLILDEFTLSKYKYFSDVTKEIILDYKDGILVPISMYLNSDTEYIFRVYLRSINGNKKVDLGLKYKNTELHRQTSFIKDDELFLEFAYKNDHKKKKVDLILERPLSAKGKIAINKIIVAKYDEANAYSENFDINSVFSGVISVNDIKTAVTDVKVLSKEFATINNIEKESNQIIQSNFLLEATSNSAMMWLYKLKPYIKFHGGKTITVSKIGQLKPSEFLFIDEWDFNVTPTHEDFKALNDSSTIIVPSVVNFAFLKYKLTNNKRIIISNKFWPIPNKIIKDKNVNNYYLYFEKNPKITNLLFNIWDEKFGKLLVVGTRSKLPKFASYISEYDSYENLFYYIYNCKAVIDLSYNNYYQSSILNLCTTINKPIITSNYNKIIENKNNIAYFSSKDDNSSVLYSALQKINNMSDNLQVEFQQNDQLFKSSVLGVL